MSESASGRKTMFESVKGDFSYGFQEERIEVSIRSIGLHTLLRRPWS